MKPSPLLVVYLTVFLDLLGFGIILPLLPFYAERFGATGVWVGALLTAYSAAQFVGAPILGRLSDRFGRRPIILLSLAGSAISLTLTGLADSLLLLLVARALAGLFGGSISSAQAYIADVTPPEQRAKYMGLLGASIGMGFIFGPGLGAGLSGFGFGAAAFAAAALAAANWLFAFLKLAESRDLSRIPAPSARLNLATFVEALQHPAIGRILGTTFLTTMAFVGMEATFALFGERRYGLNSRDLGLVFVYVGVVIALVQGGLIGRLNHAYGERRLAIAGAVLMCASLLGLPLAPALLPGMVVLGVLALGQGLASPTLSSLLSQETDADEQGGILGIGQSLSALARAIGPLLAGWLFDRGEATPYIVGAALAILGAWLLIGAATRQHIAAVSAGEATMSP